MKIPEKSTSIINKPYYSIKSILFLILNFIPLITCQSSGYIFYKRKDKEYMVNTTNHDVFLDDKKGTIFEFHMDGDKLMIYNGKYLGLKSGKNKEKSVKLVENESFWNVEDHGDYHVLKKHGKCLTERGLKLYLEECKKGSLVGLKKNTKLNKKNDSISSDSVNEDTTSSNDEDDPIVSSRQKFILGKNEGEKDIHYIVTSTLVEHETQTLTNTNVLTVTETDTVMATQTVTSTSQLILTEKVKVYSVDENEIPKNPHENDESSSSSGYVDKTVPKGMLFTDDKKFLEKLNNPEKKENLKGKAKKFIKKIGNMLKDEKNDNSSDYGSSTSSNAGELGGGEYSIEKEGNKKNKGLPGSVNLENHGKIVKSDYKSDGGTKSLINHSDHESSDESSYFHKSHNHINKGHNHDTYNHDNKGHDTYNHDTHDHDTHDHDTHDHKNNEHENYSAHSSYNNTHSNQKRDKITGHPGDFKDEIKNNNQNNNSLKTAVSIRTKESFTLPVNKESLTFPVNKESLTLPGNKENISLPVNKENFNNVQGDLNPHLAKNTKISQKTKISGHTHNPHLSHESHIKEELKSGIDKPKPSITKNPTMNKKLIFEDLDKIKLDNLDENQLGELSLVAFYDDTLNDLKKNIENMGNVDIFEPDLNKASDPKPEKEVNHDVEDVSSHGEEFLSKYEKIKNYDDSSKKLSKGEKVVHEFSKSYSYPSNFKKNEESLGNKNQRDLGNPINSNLSNQTAESINQGIPLQTLNGNYDNTLYNSNSVQKSTLEGYGINNHGSDNELSNYQPQNYQPQNYQPQNYQPQNYQPQNYQPQNYTQPTYKSPGSQGQVYYYPFN
ncbi:hypothetical protein DMUE_4240 [Dictyocoela muelleri]|nr:hypothetical protein DMUE_4240 [Dictyocoela muelleri]